MPAELISKKRVSTQDEPNMDCVAPPSKKFQNSLPHGTLLYSGRKARSQIANVNVVRQPSIPVIITEPCLNIENEVFDLSVEFVAKEFLCKGAAFPRLPRGTIYIVVANSDKNYIYAFEKEVLARASSWFAQTLKQPFNDYDTLLAEKIMKSCGYEARYELKYNSRFGKWGLQKSSFTTTLKTAMPIVESLPSNHQPLNTTRLPLVDPNKKAILKNLALNSSAANDVAATNSTSTLITMNTTNENWHAQYTSAIKKEDKAIKNEESIDAKLYTNQEDGGRKTQTWDDAKISVKNEEKAPHYGTSCGIPLQICEAYNNMFLIMHNMAPKIDISNVDIALQQTEDLIQISGYYNFETSVRPHLCNHLLNYGRELHKAVLKNPPRWLLVSLFLRSAVIFKEAIVHMVGSYPNYHWQSPSVEQLPGDVLRLLDLKAKELKTLKAAVNEELFTSSIAIKGHTMTLSNIDKATFDTWFIVQLWRDWFCNSLSKHSKSKHTVGTLYRLMAKGNDSYLPQTTVYTSLQKYCGKDFSMCSLRDVEEDLRLMKEFAQRKVRDLVVNHSMLDVEEAGIKHLTCTKVEIDDLPWN